MPPYAVRTQLKRKRKKYEPWLRLSAAPTVRKQPYHKRSYCLAGSDFSRFCLVVVINQPGLHSLIEYIKGSHPAWVSHFVRNDYYAICWM
ncbi:hypothetical protein BDV27DRAFT_137130 [Aspergillus caelatus]|uniref:Uncharacterized protein n=1 Tax=Aspergillus caelatus TaxID=61420 RepID=A0A5N6ZMF5_9EURO|nr:uncharacterized protein BDV27DRAFT_137130 [Aspergillus caelatus]KAE8358794.1 hypothetical protein BDV27DRAFT_137130 [Aspergillus caelatus]